MNSVLDDQFSYLYPNTALLSYNEIIPGGIG